MNWIISDKAIENIRSAKGGVPGLMVALELGQRQIQKHLEKKSLILTTKNAVESIKASTGLSEDQILELVN